MILFTILAAFSLDPPAAAPSDMAAAQPPATIVQAAPTPYVTEDGFRFGIDTAATITAKLGKPNSKSVSSDGAMTISYSSIHTRVKGATFIPIVGLFAGGAKAKTATKSFVLGVDGLLKGYSSGDTQINCGIGPFGGGCH